MARKALIEKEANRAKLAAKYASKRERLLEVAKDKTASAEERFAARQKLAALPRNSHPSRARNRCQLTGRPRGNYRKFKLCRIKFRELASAGQIPGVVKSSW